MKRLGPAVLAVVLMSLGCHPPLRGPEPIASPMSVSRAVEATTRSAQLYDRFITTMDVEAIYLSWDLRLGLL